MYLHTLAVAAKRQSLNLFSALAESRAPQRLAKMAVITMGTGLSTATIEIVALGRWAVPLKVTAGATPVATKIATRLAGTVKIMMVTEGSTARISIARSTADVPKGPKTPSRPVRMAATTTETWNRGSIAMIEIAVQLWPTMPALSTPFAAGSSALRRAVAHGFGLILLASAVSAHALEGAAIRVSLALWPERQTTRESVGRGVRSHRRRCPQSWLSKREVRPIRRGPLRRSRARTGNRCTCTRVCVGGGRTKTPKT